MQDTTHTRIGRSIKNVVRPTQSIVEASCSHAYVVAETTYVLLILYVTLFTRTEDAGNVSCNSVEQILYTHLSTHMRDTNKSSGRLIQLPKCSLCVSDTAPYDCDLYGYAGYAERCCGVVFVCRKLNKTPHNAIMFATQ